MYGSEGVACMVVEETKKDKGKVCISKLNTQCKYEYLLEIYANNY